MANKSSYPEAVVKILFKVIEKTQGGGASMEDLQGAYHEAAGRYPSRRTIQRIIRRINQMFDPLAYGESPEEENHCYDQEEVITGSRVIESRRKRGQSYYVFTGNIGAVGNNTSDAQMVLLSLFPQQRSALKQGLEQVLQNTLHHVLTGISSFAMLFNEMDRFVHVSGPVPTDAPRSAAIIRTVLQALREKRRVRLRYLRTYDGSITNREVEPYGLLYRFNQWYLLGWCNQRKEKRLFLLEQIEDLELLQARFAIPEGFSLPELYRHSWSVWTEEVPGDPETVRLRVAKGPSERFRMIKFHDTQKVKRLPGGDLEVTYKIVGAQSMIPWLMGWGNLVEVLEPEWLRQEMTAVLEKSLHVYKI